MIDVGPGENLNEVETPEEPTASALKADRGFSIS